MESRNFGVAPALEDLVGLYALRRDPVRAGVAFREINPGDVGIIAPINMTGSVMTTDVKQNISVV